MKTKCLLFITWLLLAHLAFSQDHQLLQQQVKTAKTVKEKLYALDAIANYYTWTDGGHTTARDYGREMINLAKNSEQKEMEALAYLLNGNRLVEIISSAEREKEFREYFSRVIEIAKEEDLPFYEASAYIGLSRIPFHTVWMDADEALEWGKRALSLSTGIANDSLRAMALVAVANGYNLKKNNLAAFRHFAQAVELAETIQDPYLLAYCYRIFGQFYGTLGAPDKALALLKKAAGSLSKKANLNYRDLSWLYMTQWNTTWAYLGKGDMENAFASAYELKELAKTYRLPTSYHNAHLSQLLTLNITYGKLKEAQNLIEENPQLYIFFRSFDYEHHFFESKAKLFRKANRPDSADYYYRKSIATIGKSVPYWSPGKHLQYGYFLLEERRIPQAIQQFEKARFESHKFSDLGILAASHQALDSAYHSAGNIGEAYQHKRRYHRLSDSLQQLRKDKELALLEVENEQRKLDQAQLERQTQRDYRNRIRTYGLVGGLGVLLLIAGILYRNNRQKQKTNHLLIQQKEKTDQALHELKATQEQLVQKEKMASLGELTAGIAHEIQNPLNFVNNFSDVSAELLEELKLEAKADRKEEVLALAAYLEHNLEKIHHHGRRADAIVKNMLQHSRPTSSEKELTDLNTLTEEYLRLSYYDIRTKDKDFTCTLETSYDQNLEKVKVVPQELGRVLLNLFNNAFYAVQQKTKLGFPEYEPKVRVSTEIHNGMAGIRVRDNGTGIPENMKSKIFHPFFTTKPTGQGTGLGLSLSYDIITKGHGGEMRVASEEGELAEFTITLPYAPIGKEPTLHTAPYYT